jgi:glutamyl-tRNA reductase
MKKILTKAQFDDLADQITDDILHRITVDLTNKQLETIDELVQLMLRNIFEGE